MTRERWRVRVIQPSFASNGCSMLFVASAALAIAIRLLWGVSQSTS
jgi:hypothetical protein